MVLRIKNKIILKEFLNVVERSSLVTKEIILLHRFYG